MSESRSCPRCGATLPPETAPDACPRCLIRVGLDPTEPGAPTLTSYGSPERPVPHPDELAADFPALEILEVLGQGGMGVVYKARQKSLDRLVALKLLAVPDDAGPDFAERFGREARALAALSHPSIVTVHDFGRVGERFFLLMEFVDGANLHALIHDGTIEPRQALGIVTQICDALQFAHDSGVVHRDIKPENILVDRKGRVKIADFGLAKILGQGGDELKLTGARQVMGTAHYMAPEQLEHPLEVDHRADLYSLGVVFYELLTGELPLGRFQPPSKKISVDLRIDEVVLRSLEKEPHLRYQQASQIKTDVEAISDTLGASSPQAAAAGPPAGRGMPRWVLPVVIMAFVLAAASFAVLVGVMPRRPLALPIPVSTESSAASRVDQGAGQALIEAAGEGYAGGVEALLDSGVDVNATGNRGVTALLMAAARGDEPLSDLLIAAGADVNAAGPGGATPLFEAVDGGHATVLEKLLLAGADPTVHARDGISALGLAAVRGDAVAVRLLLEADADVDARGPQRDTPLILAIEEGHVEVTRLLIEAGADVRAVGNRGRSALTLAASSGRPELLDLLR